MSEVPLIIVQGQFLRYTLISPLMPLALTFGGFGWKPFLWSIFRWGSVAGWLHYGSTFTWNTALVVAFLSWWPAAMDNK